MACDLIRSRGRSVRAKSVRSCALFPTNSFNPLRTSYWSSLVALEVVGVSLDARATRINALANSAEMVELPLEIIHNIITISLPEPSFTNNLRFDFLLPLCHIHSSLTPFVKRLLFSHPRLRSSAAIASFLSAIEGDDEIQNSVKSLRIGNQRPYLTIGYLSNAGLRITFGLCNRLEDVWARNLEKLDFSVFCVAKALKRLFCFGLDESCFGMDNDGFGARCSAEHLSFVDTLLGSLAEDRYFHGHFPSLQRLQISTFEDGDSFRYSSLSDLVESAAGHLHHISITDANEAVNPCAQRCSELRSLTCSLSDAPHQDDQFSGPPLVSLTIENDTPTTISKLVESLGSFYSSGMIDSSTVVLILELENVDREGGIGELWEWARQKGMRLEYADGELQQSFRGGEFDEEDGFTKYADWVDAEYARREAAGEQNSEGGVDGCI